MSDSASAPQQDTPLTSLGAGRWVLDPARSSVVVRNKTFWGLATVKGTFTGVSGGGEVHQDGTAHGSLTVDTSSLDTKNAKRDTHLRSADFFDAGKHPALTFTANGITANPDGSTAAVEGELTIRGTSRPLRFTARATGVSEDTVTLSGELTVDRQDFGMTWNQLGMLKPLAMVSVTAAFTRRQD
jgi:polyisoprenoid-binding protein YceI